jgi:hypothetical protein
MRSPMDVAVMQAVDGLLVWWRMGRPCGWSLRRHLTNPRVNRHGSEAEAALATRAAQLVRLGWPIPRRQRKAR